MSYKIIYPEKFQLRYDGSEEYRECQALVTFEYGKCCKAHIHEDDHCYLVAISDGKGYHDTTYIFPEALEVLNTLPDPWEGFRQYMETH